MSLAIQHLLTLPVRMASGFMELEGRTSPEWFAGSDPGRSLGSGGGTVNVLVEAWRSTGAGEPFPEWLAGSRKLVIHSGGQSRRLPAYAACGKALMPVPVFRWARGQRLNQSLLDLQLPDFHRILEHAPETFVTMVCSGDVLLRFSDHLPPFPEVDVLGLGMWVTPEKAQDFGVFFSPRNRPGDLAFFLQKPTPSRIREHAKEYLGLVDTGMWLLSARAVGVLMRRSNWQQELQRFGEGGPGHYELYGEFGLALGRQAAKPDPEITALRTAVVALPEAEFYHFGTSSQLIESVCELQNLVVDQTKVGATRAAQQPDQVTQNSVISVDLHREKNRSLWIENSVLSSKWRISSHHVLTGIPENDWAVTLKPGDCLDVIPVDGERFCVRPYGFEDQFKGLIEADTTIWLGRPALDWFAKRGIDPLKCGIQAGVDIQDCPLFPVLKREQLSGEFIQWLFEPGTERAEPCRHARTWQQVPRLSAQELQEEAELKRLYAQRASFRHKCLAPMMENFRSSVFFRLDLESTARAFAQFPVEPPTLHFADLDDPMQRVHDCMFRSAVLRHRGLRAWQDVESRAFSMMRDLIVQEAQVTPASPRRNALDDQIVWARSPVRLDLAGGWTDTPPYCIEHGGRVLNLAVDLNGQPPIQVFARFIPEPQLVMRSIDLGTEERVATFEELESVGGPSNAFSLAKAAFALAGFSPQFHEGTPYRSLQEQLSHFGGGLEVSLLAAVPKGSGLGTSSILAATLLAALGEICGLNWDKNVLFARTLVLEQMLTTGGGWQDQAGAIYRGLKLIETTAGLVQKPTVMWYPPHLFEREYANRSILLYYTGLTRLAKNILGEIVRGLFLNSPTHLRTIGDIGANAEIAAKAIQRCDYNGLAAAVARSWALNQQLDSGTNPPEVQQILAATKDYVAGSKLLGAGGGGYLLMLAKDEAAGVRIRKVLTERSVNARARFVDFCPSETGLQVTRS